MKKLSRWASRHVRAAIGLLILCEVANAGNGLLLGMNLLDNWQPGHLVLLSIGLVAVAILIQTQPAYRVNQPYWNTRRWLFGAFFTNFLLFMLLGGFWATSVHTPTAGQTAWGIRRVDVQVDTIIPSTSRSSTNPAYYEERTVVADSQPPNQPGKRIGFVLLFLLGIVLSGYAVGLACNLACAGNGTAAFLVVLLGTGVFAGGFFFLSRAFDKVVKPWKQTNRPERKRVYIRALLLLLGFWAITLLIGSLTNS